MARFAVLYTNSRPGLDKVIEADTYKVDAKFFTFLKDKEVVRSLKVDVVVQIRRMDEDEEDGQDEREESDAVQQARAQAAAKRTPVARTRRLRTPTDNV